MKLLYLLLLALLPLRDIDRLGRQLHALDWLGRWSLHDVVALVLTILLIQRQGAYDAAADSGLYAFTAAVMLTLLGCTWLRSDVVALRLRAPAPKAAYASAMGGLAFVLAAALLALGVMLPAIRLPGGYAGTDQHSLATLIWALYGQQERFACAVIAVLAVLLPGIKLLSLLVLIVSRRLPYWIRARSVSATAWLGGYAIADVMVLALMAFYLGAPGRAGASVLPGAYCFAASALITMVAYGWANSPAPTTVQHTSLAERLAGVASAETSARR
jgi:paraquat-inducible protein A